MRGVLNEVGSRRQSNRSSGSWCRRVALCRDRQAAREAECEQARTRQVKRAEITAGSSRMVKRQWKERLKQSGTVPEVKCKKGRETGGRGEGAGLRVEV